MADSNVFSKDPNAVLDYKFDWKGKTNAGKDSDWLTTGETIISHTVTAAAGLTVDSSLTTDDDTSVTAWLSGGTVGNRYSVTCHITTSAGRQEDSSIYVDMRDH